MSGVAPVSPVTFQSTHPLRGATGERRICANALTISIHAPLAGCDYRRGVLKADIVNFNPRTPCGVRLGFALAMINTLPFQSTHPLRGATHKTVFAELPNISAISIHAPLAGCDKEKKDDKRRKYYFNPRTPCGVRLEKTLLLTIVPKFQSTHPLRGATQDINDRLLYFNISIHAPLAGCDQNDKEDFSLYNDFNPRTPCGVRPGSCFICRVIFAISIHAPLAGCDIEHVLQRLHPKIFQSTHPLRGATRENVASYHCP